MHTDTTAAPISFIEEFPSHAHDLLQAILGTAASLALAATIGTWLLVHQSGAGVPASAAHSSHSEAALTARAGAGSVRLNPAQASAGVDAPWHSPVTASNDLTVKTLYIVASQEQQDTLRARLAEASAVRDSMGLPPLDERVVLFVSEEEEALFLLARSEEDTVRGGAGLAPLRLGTSVGGITEPPAATPNVIARTRWRTPAGTRTPSGRVSGVRGRGQSSDVPSVDGLTLPHRARC